ncbi:MAG: hypothetical protein ACD_41C00349G0005 [uncultured bacterium]|nr:MAG: hypothetical protein ACD_41C00349G0005 [uncultured bacterium]HBY73173.1 hypothetical protein [Candidatus Kerfeldbacteria bacterium]
MKNTKPSAIRRLKIVEGQIRALQRMVERGDYCIDVLTQTAAVRHALSGVEDMILEGHLSTCAAQQMKSGKVAKATEEVLKVYRLSKRK